MLPLADWISEHLLGVEPFELVGFLGLSWHCISLFVAAGLMLWIFPEIAKDDGLVPGKVRSFFESILLFIRDEVARPCLHERADRYLPVLWTFFFFILFCNLLGLVPNLLLAALAATLGYAGWRLDEAQGAGGRFHTVVALLLGGAIWLWGLANGGGQLFTTSTATATGQIWVTGTLACTALIWYQLAGAYEQGLLPWLKNSLIPPGLPFWLVPVLMVVEFIGHLAKPFALMVRLWANMTGGHAVLYAIIGFIFIFSATGGVGAKVVPPIAVLGAVGVYFLEIFVAFLQAYVFTFLVTVFLAAAVQPEH